MGYSFSVAFLLSALVMGCGPSGEITSGEPEEPGEQVCVPYSANCNDGLDEQQVCRGDGSGWDTTACAESTCSPDTGRCIEEEEQCDMRLFVLLDQSGSMDGEKWQQARAALSTLMMSDAVDQVEIGFGAFPADGSCGVDNLVIDALPDASADTIDSYLADHTPTGGTPLAAALSEILAVDPTGLSDPDYHNALLVVSDGADSCASDPTACILSCGLDILCTQQCIDDTDAMTAVGIGDTVRAMRDDLEIRTFAIGFGDDVGDEQLKAIAENGGTVLGSWVPAGDVSELEQALDMILNEVQSCSSIVVN